MSLEEAIGYVASDELIEVRCTVRGNVGIFDFQFKFSNIQGPSIDFTYKSYFLNMLQFLVVNIRSNYVAASGFQWYFSVYSYHV